MTTKYIDSLTFISENKIGTPSAVTLSDIGTGIITATTEAMQFLGLNYRVILCSQLISSDIEILEKFDLNEYDYIIFDDFGRCDDKTLNEITDYIKRHINEKHFIIVKTPENSEWSKNVNFNFNTANYTWHFDKALPYKHGYTKESEN